MINAKEARERAVESHKNGHYSTLLKASYILIKNAAKAGQFVISVPKKFFEEVTDEQFHLYAEELRSQGFTITNSSYQALSKERDLTVKW